MSEVYDKKKCASVSKYPLFLSDLITC